MREVKRRRKKKKKKENQNKRRREGEVIKHFRPVRRPNREVVRLPPYEYKGARPTLESLLVRLSGW